MTVYLITKNAGKTKAAESVFNAYNIEIKSIDKEYPEIQADSSAVIARYAAVQASAEFNAPVIREDHSLFIDALGFPGPYTSYIEKHLTAERLLYLLRDEENRGGYFEIAAVYAEPNGATKEFVYQVPVYVKKDIVVEDERGGWNSILCLKGETRAFTEYPEKERLHVWNKNYLHIAQFLADN